MSKQASLTDKSYLEELPSYKTNIHTHWRSAEDVADVFGDQAGAVRARFRRYQGHGWLHARHAGGTTVYALSPRGLYILKHGVNPSAPRRT